MVLLAQLRFSWIISLSIKYIKTKADQIFT